MHTAREDITAAAHVSLHTAEHAVDARARGAGAERLGQAEPQAPQSPAGRTGPPIPSQEAADPREQGDPASAQ